MSSQDFHVRDTAQSDITSLTEATNATFADYFLPISHTVAGFGAFCRWYSIDPAQSVLLEHTDGRVAGLSMLAIRGSRGWCGGFGIVPEFRGHGLAATLVTALIGQAHTQNLATLQLEVLVQNKRALKTYQKAGFETVRDLVILSGTPRPALAVPGSAFDIERASPADVWLSGRGLPFPVPCWQREPVSLLTMNEVNGLIARQDGEVVGALLYRANAPAGPLTLGHLSFATEEAARALLARATADTQIAALYMLNEPDDSPVAALLRSLGLSEIHRQHEMVLPLA